MCSTGSSLVCSPPSPRARLKLLQQELRALGHASLEKPMLERAEDQAVVTAGDPAGNHGAEGCAHPLVHREIQQHRAQSFSLAGTGRHGICRREGQLAALDLQDLFLALVVQVPRQLLRLDWIHTWFVDAVQLPSGAFELECTRPTLCLRRRFSGDSSTLWKRATRMPIAKGSMPGKPLVSLSCTSASWTANAPGRTEGVNHME